MPVICLHAERLPAAGLALKRVVDVAGAGVALTVLSPLLAIIAGLIKLDSRGPVLYCAQRAGRKGRLFRCYKFRTMVSDADSLKDHLRRTNERSGRASRSRKIHGLRGWDVFCGATAWMNYRSSGTL